MQYSLWQKLLVLFLAVFLVSVGGLTYASYYTSRNAILEEFKIRGRELTKAIASESKNYYLSQDVEGLASLLQTLGEAEGVLAILAYDASQSLWIEFSIVELSQSEIRLPSPTPIFQQDTLLSEGASVSQFINVVLHGIPDTHPDVPGSQDSKSFIGWIRILLDRHPLEERLNNLLQQTLLINGFTTLFGGGILVFLLRQSLKIIEPLTIATREVAKGNLTISVPATTHDELGQLAVSFNQMTQRLHDTTVSKLYVENILKSMINSLIVIGPDENIHSTNQATLSLLGYQESEIIGQEIDIIFPRSTNPFRDKEYYQLILNGTLGHIETWYLTKDGQTIPVLFSAAVMKEHGGNMQGIACVAQDITKHKQTENALRHSVERFDMAVRGSQDGIWDVWAASDNLFNPHNPIYYSPRFKELLGYEDNEFENIIGTWISRLHPEDQAQALDDLKIHLEQRIPYDSTYRILTKNGEYRWFAGRGQAIWDESGIPIRMSGSVRDITEHKRAEEELQKANVQLQELDHLRTQFFADISHELRTPLTVIRGEAEVTLRGRDKPVQEYKMTLGRIVQLTKEVNQMVNDLLFLARSESGTLLITKQECSLRDLLYDVHREAVILAQKKSISVNMTDTSQEILIKGDPQRLKQLFLILLDNAVKYSAAKSQIDISLALKAKETSVLITDYGRGIPEADIPHIFERFYRVHSTQSQPASPPGAGLGLAIAKWITEAHQGRITVTSHLGSGTQVIVTLSIC